MIIKSKTGMLSNSNFQLDESGWKQEEEMLVG
jgi:hypothetical protein